MHMSIRTCRHADLAALNEHMPADDLGRHRVRLAEQEKGESTYFVGWVDGVPVAHLVIRWPGSVHEHVRARFPQTPELRRFAVAAGCRGNGIGSRMLAFAEDVVAQRGFGSLGLAVGTANSGARRLYEREGYRDWGRGTFESSWMRLTDDGRTDRHSHVVTYMLKALLAQARTSAVA